MKIDSILSISTSSISLLLSLWLCVVSLSANSMQATLQKLQEDLQSRQQAVQLQQQQLQAQQQQIESAKQLAQQVGPAVVRDLASLQVQNKNTKIAAILKKYGIEIKENPSSPLP